MNRFLLSVLLLLGAGHLAAQRTVGLQSIDGDAYDGYTLFAPMPSTETFLIDVCGDEVHSWLSNYRPGLSAYLLDNGDLLRCGNVGNSSFTAGGSGGVVEIIDWNGSLQWQFNYSSSTYLQHHDVEYLPNGNVLIIVWTVKSASDAVSNGRDPNNVGNAIWPDQIIEVERTGPTSGNIVWEWNAWDHLVQDFDSSKANFGVVADHPELIDINFLGTGPLASPDWMHTNSVDYHAEWDQILLSVHDFGEIWVIDHSTSTQEAAGHSGGNYGKGGDLLYRWGNPQAYGRGNAANQQLFVQHDANWIEDSLPMAGHIMIYNNGGGRPGGFYSSVEIIQPPVDSNGVYALNGSQAYDPALPAWTYDGLPSDSWYSPNVSGAHMLPNGNTLICNGPVGTFFEVDSTGQKHWEYINPISISGPVNQGSPPPNNGTFRIHRYSADHPGLAGRNLNPIGPLEASPYSPLAFCATISVSPEAEQSVFAYPLPFREGFRIRTGTTPATIQITDVHGKVLVSEMRCEDDSFIDARGWSPGVYFLRVMGDEPQVIRLIRN